MSEEWTTKKIDKYVIVNKKLGGGAFGIVYRGFFADDESKQVAVKTIPIKTIQDSSKMLELIKREISILQKINHPNVVKLFDVARTSNYLYMFLEYCADGDLKEYISKHKNSKDKRMSEVESVIFLKHIIEGFKQIYKQNIIHRDIKPANILLHHGQAKITDFGFARVLETEMNDPAYLSRLGSPLYMAPQILEGQPFSAKCDIWSLGIMFYEMLYGKTPWTGENQVGLLNNIKKVPLKFPETPVRSQKVKDFIGQMLIVPEKDRISWEAVFNHDIVKIDEEQIKHNMESIQKEKNEVLRSAGLNRLYLEQNLVMGYIEPKVNQEQIQSNAFQQQSNASMDQSNQTIAKITSQNYDEDNQYTGQKLITTMENDKKKRDANLKYSQYFQFERNIAFFFNFVVQEFISAYSHGKLTVDEQTYYKLLFILTKNQLIHLERLRLILVDVNQNKFDQENWGKYMLTTEYTKILNQIDLDMKKITELYQQILKKNKEINSDKSLEQVLNNDINGSQAFINIYHNSLVNLIKKFKAELKGEDREIAILFFYSLICLNPYDEFKDINIDFNSFYEECRHFTFAEILEKLNKKQGIQSVSQSHS